MVSAWPVTLPPSMLIEGYQEQMGDGRRASSTDTGPGKVYRKTSAMPDAMGCSMLLTTAQLAIFRTFYKTTLLEGALPFNIGDPKTASTLLVRFRIGSTPAISTTDGKNWLVTMPLDIMP